MRTNFQHSIFLFVFLFVFAFSSFVQAQIISTFAGNGSAVSSGDGGPATVAGIYHPSWLAADTSGNLYISTDDYRVRKITSAGIISTVAGTGLAGFSGDGGPATNAQLNIPLALSVDPAGNLLISDIINYRIRKVDAAGIITTVAGNGTSGYAGDGGPATGASLPMQFWHTTDKNGNLYVSGTKIRKIDATTGIISFFAGDGTGIHSGDGGPATAAGINGEALAIDNAGNLFIAEQYRIRKIDTAGIITTIAGDGTMGFSGDGGPATAAHIDQIYGISVDVAENIFLTESFLNPRVRKINSLGIITTIAGDGITGYAGDGGPATAAEFHDIAGIIKKGSGNIFIADGLNNRVRMITDTNHAVHFVGGHHLNFNVCAASMSIDTLLAATDADSAQVEKWNIISGPLHGTAMATYVTYSTGGVLLPTGLTYTPTIGYIGPDTLKVRVTDGYTADTAIVYIRVDTTLPFAGGIAGPDSVCIGHTITLTDTIAGGVWSGNTRALVSAGSITGAITGIDTISYIVTNGCGADTANYIIHVRDCSAGVNSLAANDVLNIYPNPNYGTFTLLFPPALNEPVHIIITNLLGEKIKELTAKTDETVTVLSDAPAGIYFLTLNTSQGMYNARVVVAK